MIKIIFFFQGSGLWICEWVHKRPLLDWQCGKLKPLPGYSRTYDMLWREKNKDPAILKRSACRDTVTGPTNAFLYNMTAGFFHRSTRYFVEDFMPSFSW